MAERASKRAALRNQVLEAAENNRMDSLKSLLDTNLSLINCTDEDGYSPLHRASYNNHVDIVKFLLSRGAKIDSRTIDGWQPIHCAARWNNADTAIVLLQHGSDINSMTNGGLTPLHIAAGQPDSREVLLLLLTNTNVDPTIVNSLGETAQCTAIRCSRHAKLFEIVDPSINKI